MPKRSFQRSFNSSASKGKVVQFPLAQTGEGIKECELIRWFVKEGDTVEEFDKLCEVQSDKAAVEISSRYSGTLLHLHHQEGQIVQVGAPLVDIQLPGGEVPDEEVAPQQQDVDARQIDAEGAAAGRGPAAHAPTLASPAVRRIARECGIHLAGVRGTGPGGRILKGDVLALLDGRAAQAGPVQLQQPPPSQSPAALHAALLTSAPPLPAPAVAEQGSDGRGDVQVLALRGYRRAMLSSMSAACSVPHFHLCDQLLLGPLLELRERLRDNPLLAGSQLTPLAFVIKATSEALKDFPEMNSSLDAECRQLRVHSRHNIGVAMATRAGLVVPNIKGVQELSLVQIAAELARLKALAMDNCLAPADISGGTISISNIGTIGGTYATPLVNPPEVAIVALGRVSRLPRYDPQGALRPTPVMCVSWGADHRVVDGAQLALFNNNWKAYLEHPERLLLRLK